MEGRKEEKGEEIKEKAIRPFGVEEKREEKDSAILGNCVNESKRENCERYIVKKGAASEKNKKKFFFLSCFLPTPFEDMTLSVLESQLKTAY